MPSAADAGMRVGQFGTHADFDASPQRRIAGKFCPLGLRFGHHSSREQFLRQSFFVASSNSPS